MSLICPLFTRWNEEGAVAGADYGRLISLKVAVLVPAIGRFGQSISHLPSIANAKSGALLK